MEERTGHYPPALMRAAEKQILLQVLDTLWKGHLLQLDHLRQGIGLRAYAQRDPLNEYKQEAFALFETMMHNLRIHTCQLLAFVELRTDSSAQSQGSESFEADVSGGDVPARVSPGGKKGALQSGGAKSGVARSAKIPRNAPCPCGSGRKYKQCHGKL